jgi:hypothetical protein
MQSDCQAVVAAIFYQYSIIEKIKLYRPPGGRFAHKVIDVAAAPYAARACSTLRHKKPKEVKQ